MSHTPFILAAYSIAVVLLGWCAVAPLVKGRRLRRFILSRGNYEEQKDASDA
jgi:hypothetical protein